MESFSFRNPVQIYFGNGVHRDVGHRLKERGYKKLLFVCGAGPFHENGLFQEVCDDLKRHDFEVYSMRDVDSNPKLSSLREGADICKKNHVDCILALGGGSAIDCTKGIGAAAKMGVDPYDLYWGKKVSVTGTIDTVMVPTIAATGSELNSSSVAVDEQTKEKFFFDSMHPKMAFMDPELTLSVPIKLTIWGAMDILSHTFEFYFNGNTGSEFQRRFSEAILLSTMHCVEQLMKNPGDLTARGELMWCSAITWGTGLTMIGRGLPDMACHGIEESFSGFFDTHHGACLGVLTPRWMERVCCIRPDLFSRFARHVMGVIEADDEKAALQGVIAYRNWLKQVGAPNTYFDIGDLAFRDEELARVAKTACRIYEGGVGRMHRFHEQEVYDLLLAGKNAY